MNLSKKIVDPTSTNLGRNDKGVFFSICGVIEPIVLIKKDIQSGIYGILNKITGKMYVGSAVWLQSRMSTHRTNLNLLKHSNKHLQAAWNKDGVDNFEFLILEYVENKIDLTEREQYWIDLTLVCDPSIGYNKRKNATSNLGLKRPFTEEHKAKIGASNKGKKRSPEACLKNSLGHFGIRQSPESIRKTIEARAWYKPSEDTKAKIGAANAKADKWPHEDRSKCKCRDCADKRNEMRKIYNGSQNFVLVTS